MAKSKCKRIILNLKREWFEKIRSGEKRIEYRKVGPYWIGRFCHPVMKGRGVNNGYEIRKFKTVEFRCGYSKKDAIVFEIANIDIGPCPYEGWDGNYFRIHLGALLVIEDEKEYLTSKSEHDMTDTINNLLIKSGLVDVAAIVAKELAAKDAEIARLKRENFDVNGCLLAEQELAEKRNSLIKELADALECRLCDFTCEIHGECLADMKQGECESFKFRPLVAKAREVVK